MFYGIKLEAVHMRVANGLRFPQHNHHCHNYSLSSSQLLETRQQVMRD
jgi:hypothetical protein